MSAPQNDGEPAFPVPVGEREFWDREENGSPNGMSLRDYFAAAAMQGFVSSYPNGAAGDAEAISHDSYTLADAMLAARKEGA
jgi:hypothetical protein